MQTKHFNQKLRDRLTDVSIVQLRTLYIHIGTLIELKVTEETYKSKEAVKATLEGIDIVASTIEKTLSTKKSNYIEDTEKPTI